MEVGGWKSAFLTKGQHLRRSAAKQFAAPQAHPTKSMQEMGSRVSEVCVRVRQTKKRWAKSERRHERGAPSGRLRRARLLERLRRKKWGWAKPEKG
jgi:hypothetical protein